MTEERVPVQPQSVEPTKLSEGGGTKQPPTTEPAEKTEHKGRRDLKEKLLEAAEVK